MFITCVFVSVLLNMLRTIPQIFGLMAAECTLVSVNQSHVVLENSFGYTSGLRSMCFWREFRDPIENQVRSSSEGMEWDRVGIRVEEWGEETNRWRKT